MINIICFNCGKSLEAPDEAAGKKGRCSGCGVNRKNLQNAVFIDLRQLFLYIFEEPFAVL